MRLTLPMRASLIASIGVICSAGLALWSFQEAIALDPLPVPDSTSATIGMPRSVERPSHSIRSVLAAAEKDPFRPERNRSSARFRLPEERLVQVPQPAEAAVAPAAVRLLGTMVLPEGKSVALCQWGSDSPRLVRIGEMIGDLTLKRVEQGKAVFASAQGATVEVFVPKQGT